MKPFLAPPLLEILPFLGLRDPFSALSHMLGALLSIIALIALIIRGRRRGMRGWPLVELTIYGVTMVLMFTASALFHAFDWSAMDLVLFKKLDHASIFLIIAGTGTAIYGRVGTRKALWLSGLMWVVCLAALAVKMIVWPMPLWLSALTYVGVGWLGVVGIASLGARYGWRSLRRFIAGGLVFTLGAVLFALEWPVVWPGVIEGHEVFHVLVLVGIGLHYFFVYEHCVVGDAGSTQVWPSLEEVQVGLGWKPDGAPDSTLSVGARVVGKGGE